MIIDLVPQDLLEYRSRVRPLQVRTMDGTVHSLSVDDSLCVGDLTKLFAESIGTCGACVARHVGGGVVHMRPSVKLTLPVSATP